MIKKIWCLFVSILIISQLSYARDGEDKTGNLREMFQNNQAVIYAVNLRTFNANDKNGNGIIEFSLGETSGSFINAIERLDELNVLASEYAQTSSDCEKLATKAEREAEDIKKAEFMQSKIGEIYDGIVSSVTSFGMFVELDNTVEGYIGFDKMGDEYFTLESAFITVFYPSADVLKFTLEDSAVNDPVTEVFIPKAAQPEMKYSDEKVLLSGLTPNTFVWIFDLQGKLAFTQSVSESGDCRVSLESLPTGIYIVKTEKSNYKIVFQNEKGIIVEK